MRILLTPIGQEVVRILAEQAQLINREKLEKSQSSIPRVGVRKTTGTNNTNLLNISNSSALYQHTKNSNSRHKSDLLQKLEMDQTQISLDELNKSKEILVKQRKLNISKTVTDRYNEVHNLPELTAIDTAIGLPTLNSNMTTRTKLTIKEILNESSYNLLKTEHKNQKRMKDRLSRVDETQFRSTYEQKNHLEKLDEKLCKKINPDRINLINYLKEKEKVSEVLIKKIYDYDEEKINKMNKICQMVFHNNDNAKLFDEIIKNKLNIVKNKEKSEYKKEIEKMGANVEGISMILKNYEKKVNDRERYRELHNDLVKNYWRKNNIDRIARNVSPRNRHFQTNSTTIDNTNEYRLNTNINTTNMNTNVSINKNTLSRILHTEN